MRVTEDWLWEAIWVAKVLRVCFALTVSDVDPEAKYTVPETLVATGVASATQVSV